MLPVRLVSSLAISNNRGADKKVILKLNDRSGKMGGWIAIRSQNSGMSNDLMVTAFAHFL